MPLVIPSIDDRSYQEILAEALARIPVHNPEWTNFNDADPGVTLLQLFAFMSESLLYRANLIPERNRLKFLKLLGVPLLPAAAAQGIVTFSNPRGALQAHTLSAGLEVYAGQVPFRTLDALDVLPIEGKVYYKSPLSDEDREEVEDVYEQLYASFSDTSSELDYYETRLLEAPASGAVFPTLDLANDTIDGALWVALLARSADLVDATRDAIASKVLLLGVLPSLTDASRVLSPGGQATTSSQTGLVFELPKGGALPDQASLRVATYKRLIDARPSGDLLSEPGVVQLTLPKKDELKLWTDLEPLELGVGDFPPYLEDDAVSDRLITWLRIRMPDRSSTSSVSTQQLSVKLSWVGVNAVRVTQRAKITSENVGLGTGEPDQSFALVNTPVVPGSVRLTVNGELWQETDDLRNADPEVPVRSPRLTPGMATPSSSLEKSRVFTVDRESGEIRFGDGLHGARPPRNAIILASYDYGGGRQGMVGIGAINKGPTLPAGIKVTNPLPTWGGDEAQSVEDAEKEIPRYLQHRDRLVTTDDFEEITRLTPGIDLGRVEVLPLLHPSLPDVSTDGVVTVMVIPSYDPVQPDAPEPDQLFLDSVCEHLEPRRLVTTEVHVRGPEYETIWLSIGIDLVPGHDLPTVREAVKEALLTFLSPLEGGFDETGWPLSKSVEALELWAVATRVEGVSKVNGVLLGDETGASVDRVPMKGLQLPRVLGIAVQSGDPQELSALTGAGSSSTDGTTGGTGSGDGSSGSSGSSGSGTGSSKKVVPVPVVPPEC